MMLMLMLMLMLLLLPSPPLLSPVIVLLAAEAVLAEDVSAGQQQRAVSDRVKGLAAVAAVREAFVLGEDTLSESIRIHNSKSNITRKLALISRKFV